MDIYAKCRCFDLMDEFEDYVMIYRDLSEEYKSSHIGGRIVYCEYLPAVPSHLRKKQVIARVLNNRRWQLMNSENDQRYRGMSTGFVNAGLI